MAAKIWVGTDTGNEGDWGVAANWSPSGVPASTDDVFLTSSSQAVTGSLNQSAVALNSLTIDATYTGDIATESAFLQVGTSDLTIGNNFGQGDATGSGRLNIDLGSVTAATVTINATKATATDTNRSPVRLLAANASTSIFLNDGLVSIADAPDDTSTISNVDIIDGDIKLGEGVTVTSVNVKGGDFESSSAIPTLNTDGGTSVTLGAGAITTANINGGTLISNSSGTITTLNITAGTADFSQDNQARTITTLNMGQGSSIILDPGVITLTNDIALDGLDPVTVQVV